MSQIVNVSHADSVRITRPDGTTVQIPAACVLAVDAVLRHCLVEWRSLRLALVALPPGFGGSGWDADTFGWRSRRVASVRGAASPWAAMASLAGVLAKEEGAEP